MIPPSAQEFLAKRMNATVRSVASSHAPFMSKPQDAAAIISLAANSLLGQNVNGSQETVLAAASGATRRF
jgi:hypothetical protein